MARQIATQFGMNKKLGPRTFGEKEELIFLGKEIHERRDYSEKTAETIDDEVSHYIKTAHQTAHQTIMDNKEKMEKIVAELIKNETIEKETFEALVA